MDIDKSLVLKALDKLLENPKLTFGTLAIVTVWVIIWAVTKFVGAQISSLILMGIMGVVSLAFVCWLAKNIKL